jgi:hypothetical protein
MMEAAPSQNHNRNSRVLTAVLLAACIALSATGLMNAGLNAAGLGKLRASNDRYLRASFNKTLATFAVLSAVKVGLAVVQGSDVGIGFRLEVGDVVQSAYDYVDIAWRTVLGCAAVLLGTRYLLQAADFLAPWFLTAFFAFWLIHLILKWKVRKKGIAKSVFRDLLWTAGIAAATLYLALPLSIAGGRLLSAKITEPSMKEARDGFTRVKMELDSSSVQTGGGLWSKLVQARNKLAGVAEIVSRKTSELTEWVLKLIAGYAFDCFVFPILLFLFFFWLVRKTAGYFMEINRNRGFRDDLELTLKKVFPRTE